MALLLGTHEGLYRTPDVPFDRPERVLDGRCTASSHGETLLARSDGDLYESDAAGRSWSRIDTPDGHVSALHVAGDRLYAGVGTSPPSLHVSTHEGDTWRELATFHDLPSLEHYVPQQDAMQPTPQSVGMPVSVRQRRSRGG